MTFSYMYLYFDHNHTHFPILTFDYCWYPSRSPHLTLGFSIYCSVYPKCSLSKSSFIRGIWWILVFPESFNIDLSIEKYFLKCDSGKTPSASPIFLLLCSWKINSCQSKPIGRRIIKIQVVNKTSQVSGRSWKRKRLTHRFTSAFPKNVCVIMIAKQRRPSNWLPILAQRYGGTATFNNLLIH